MKLAATVLVGEDGERITIPNREVVGKVIVNSQLNRVVQTKIAVSGDTDLPDAIAAIQRVIEAHDEVSDDAQVGVHDFPYGEVILDARYWVPSTKYFQLRYQVNGDILTALRNAGVTFLEAGPVAVVATSTTGDEEEAVEEGV